MVTDLVAKIITPDNFAPFGRHMHIGQTTQGMITRAIRGGAVQLTQGKVPFENDSKASWVLDFYATPLAAAPLHITSVEQHRHSAQIFIPMGVTRWLLIVYPGHNNPFPQGNPQAFLAGPEDSISYDAGIWHHGIIALQGNGHFASMMARMPHGSDTEFADLREPLTVRWPE